MVKSPKLFFKPGFRVTLPQSRILSLKGFSVLPDREILYQKSAPNSEFGASVFLRFFVAPHDQENSSIGVFLDSHT